jgi:aspartyl-tRNA(Asn)/glutamyl-tRNA(Gln) amidotransferase subunit C
MSNQFSEEEVQRLATLAYIDLRPDEVKRLTTDLNVINESILKLQEVASDEVLPTSHPLPYSNIFREDVPATIHIPASDEPHVVDGIGDNKFEGDLLTPEQALSGGPVTEGDFFVSPSILGED